MTSISSIPSTYPHYPKLFTHDFPTTLFSVKAVDEKTCALNLLTPSVEPESTESQPSCAALEAITLLHRSHPENEVILEHYDCRTAYSIEQTPTCSSNTYQSCQNRYKCRPTSNRSRRPNIRRRPQREPGFLSCHYTFHRRNHCVTKRDDSALHNAERG